MRHGATQSFSAENRVDVTDVHRVRWVDQEEATPVTAVVTAVAELNRCDPLTLPPLIESVDPEALNRLFPPSGSKAVDSLAFRYCGYEVVVSPTEIQLRTPEIA